MSRLLDVPVILNENEKIGVVDAADRLGRYLVRFRDALDWILREDFEILMPWDAIQMDAVHAVPVTLLARAGTWIKCTGPGISFPVHIAKIVRFGVVSMNKYPVGYCVECGTYYYWDGAE